jgi:hypothetical protein
VPTTRPPAQHRKSQRAAHCTRGRRLGEEVPPFLVQGVRLELHHLVRVGCFHTRSTSEVLDGVHDGDLPRGGHQGEGEPMVKASDADADQVGHNLLSLARQPSQIGQQTPVVG